MKSHINQDSFISLCISGIRFLRQTRSFFTCLYAILLILLAGAFAETRVSGTINQNTTWTLAGSPYIVTGDVTVRHTERDSFTATLTIEPGVEVRFEPNTRLSIGYSYSSSKYYGALHAQGIQSTPVIFTSNAATPVPGDWYGIYFNDQTDCSLTVLENCVVEYASNGIYTSCASPVVRNNTIRYASQYPVSIDAGTSNISSNNCVGNNINTVAVRGGTVNADTTWQPNKVPFVVTGDVTVRASGVDDPVPVLTLEPGVTIAFPGTKLVIGYTYSSYGALYARM